MLDNTKSDSDRDPNIPIMKQLDEKELKMWVTAVLNVIKSKEELIQCNPDCGFTPDQLSEFYDEVNSKIPLQELGALLS